MNSEVERRMLGLIGLGIRARNAVIGVEQVRVAARRGRLALAVVASDASPHSRAKVLPLLQAKGIRVIEGPTTIALGSAAGRETTAAIGILDAALARGIRTLVAPQGSPRTKQNSRKEGSGTAAASPVSRLPSPVRS